MTTRKSAGSSLNDADHLDEGPVAVSMRAKLHAAFNPTLLDITNESASHAGHMGNPDGAADAETHFAVHVVSDAFDGLRSIQRHRLVYAAIDEEMKRGVGGKPPVHALSLRTETPDESV